MAFRKPQAWLLAAILFYFLFFFHLSATGMLAPDEPRYASVGREMARSGDWVTPRLWGEPWFEKPALLYWMTGAAFRLGLNADLAPRLPVAIASVAFLIFFFFTLRREFGWQPAAYATAILATSAGWVAYSQNGVTDIPLAATFSAAVLLLLRWVKSGDRHPSLPLASGMLALAVLAKGLVPLVLIAPVIWIGRRRIADLLRPQVWGTFLVIAAPWYILCYLRNGRPFLEKFFWEHHFARFSSTSLLHEQPFWFYGWVLLAGLFPWTPLVLLIRRQDDPRWRVLALTVAFGIVFFSLSVNKLPGYLLPLLPALAALMGIALAESRRNTAVLVACAVMAGFIPAIAGLLPQALARGITRSHLSVDGWMWTIPVLLGLSVMRLRAATAMLVLMTAIIAGVVYVKVASLPKVDEAYSARPIWREIAGRRDEVCIVQMERSWRYGLNYYSETPLPDCAVSERPFHIVQHPDEPPKVK
jgi:4-amino-4-deoxy-L-arabinose transferase-like glycosyltransferase